MNKNKKLYYHPVFTRYACDEDGILYGVKGLPLKSNTSKTTGYRTITVREMGIQKQYRVHRFVFECIYNIGSNFNLFFVGIFY